MKDYLKKVMMNRISPILLITVGVSGFLASVLLLYILVAFLVLVGIYGIIKKYFFVGVISLAVGLLVFLFFKFFNSFTQIISAGAIILGVVLLVFFFLRSKIKHSKKSNEKHLS